MFAPTPYLHFNPNLLVACIKLTSNSIPLDLRKNQKNTALGNLQKCRITFLFLSFFYRCFHFYFSLISFLMMEFCKFRNMFCIFLILVSCVLFLLLKEEWKIYCCVFIYGLYCLVHLFKLSVYMMF